MPPLVHDARAALFDQRQCLEECQRVGLVLLDPGRDGEHVRVEDQVLWREADLAREQVVRAAADRDAVVDVGRLALLVEGHRDDAGAVVADRAAPARGTTPRPP